jgi:hypothetical protein
MPSITTTSTTPPVNGAMRWKGIRLFMANGDVVVGCLDAIGTTDEYFSVYRMRRPLPTKHRRADVDRCEEFDTAEPPASMYKVVYTKTGGITTLVDDGDADNKPRHRRHVIALDPKAPQAPIFVIDADRTALERFVTAHDDVAFDGDGVVTSSRVTRLVVAGHRLPYTLFSLAVQGFVAVDRCDRRPPMLCDSLDRQKHTHAQKTKTVPMCDVGPSRDLWRFCIDVFPAHWIEDNLAPMTWHAIARHVLDDIPADGLVDTVFALPQPLQTHVYHEGASMLRDRLQNVHTATYRAVHAVNACDTRASALTREAEFMRLVLIARAGGCASDVARHMHDTAVLDAEACLVCEARDAAIAAREAAVEAARCVAVRAAEWHDKLAKLDDVPVARRPSQSVRYHCTPLTDEQQHQCLCIFHCVKYGAEHYERHVLQASMAAWFQYILLNGWWPHLLTHYELSKNFEGLGDELRDPNRPESSLPDVVRNRCRVVDGKLHGAGGPGCKGIVYPPRQGQAVYKPQRQRKRVLSDNAEMVSSSLPGTISDEVQRG